VSGFGDRPFTDFTRDRVAAAAAAIQAAIAAEQDARGTRSAAGARRHDGGAAAEHYCLTARAIARALRDAGVLAHNPLEGLKSPKRPRETREKALTDDELCDYLSIVIIHSPDPYLDALIWVILRVTAARNIEVLSLDVLGAAPERPSLSLVGKGGPEREQPAHRPLLDLVLELARSRPRSDTAALLRTRRGARVDGHIFDDWSRHLHTHAPWSHGHRIGVHALRHSTARAVNDRCGETSHTTRLFLGHKGADRGAVATYLHSDFTDAWRLRCEIAERVFGPLDAWPVLPENDVLRALLPGGPWS
jgi:integrase